MQESDKRLETVERLDPYATKRQALPTFIDRLWWQEKSLMYTATGYGHKIPTEYKVKHNGRLKRVYCRIFSNSGSLYILHKGKEIAIDEC